MEYLDFQPPLVIELATRPESLTALERFTARVLAWLEDYEQRRAPAHFGKLAGM